MQSWHSYPKINSLSNKYTRDIFKGIVLIEEKIDGSQFSFGIFDGQIKMRTRGGEISIENHDKMFSKAIETVTKLAPLLRNNCTYIGEYLQRPKHNILAYDRVPNSNIIIYDIRIGKEAYMSQIDKVAECSRLGLETVPMLFLGVVSDIPQLEKLIENTSCLGRQKIEGIVIKNYSVSNVDGSPIFGKLVSESFKEINSNGFKTSKNLNNDIILLLTDSLSTEGRWHKAVQHLKEKGELKHSSEDIGNLIREFNKDLHEECEDFIKEKLFEWAFPKILKGTTSGFVEWYKKILWEEIEINRN